MAILLLLGPSGVGKSTIKDLIVGLDDRFSYIKPFTTREIRPGENDKFQLTREELDSRVANSEFVVVNNVYGTLYATPLQPILDQLAVGRFPLIDWPISKLETMRKAFPRHVVACYIKPPNLEAIVHRLEKRGTNNDRIQAVVNEWNQLQAGDFDDKVNFFVENKEDEQAVVANIIRSHFLELVSNERITNI